MSSIRNLDVISGTIKQELVMAYEVLPFLTWLWIVAVFFFFKSFLKEF